ncbi:telomeric repeat-binding factor 2-interacting protein 1 [Neopsephotus bourkii]|uniref:telomeric repeat-binding factor 2-interacting protein 1 n=1 Tax=Neopsephotus bourkii TaxID=309878 RepID=UPI002AA57C56|nr:telomeric repeat-binding factor 2-interacting protein 1 [Neopsephotus bourkii]
MANRSRSLFLCDNGNPMRFYVRPGMAKLRLAPLVLAGGGRLCRVQEPGALLLAQPGEAAPDGSVSTEYVTECVRRNERLPLDPFRLPAAPAAAAAAAPRGRLAFSPAEDAALLRAVRERGEARARGRALWQELERARLMPHSWQAMRDRYLRHLRPAQRAGLFEAANREFDNMESRSGTSEISGEVPTKERISPGETASGLKTVLQDSAGPDTRLQMEEQPTSTCSSSRTVGDAVKMMQCLMETSSMDLLTVTQAFLKNSGDAEATLHFLQTGRRQDGYPVWSREDDLELQKDDESVRNKLIAKFGAENVAKRVAFRKS